VRLGLVARADEGGLGTQTWEYARHLAPDAILIVHNRPERGRYKASRYRGLAPLVLEADHPPDRLAPGRYREFLEAVDVVLSAETFYTESFVANARARDVACVLHANPELYDSGPRPPFRVWAPTGWEVDRLPAGTPVLPVPVDRERCSTRPA
jgi:hypothetical protein